ncbi:riboflavin synthase [Candidatus Magnetaquicoccus inordinatus]|uniref:riboflavin synthase n=1 Tax=Candidatus Magnetaquicoccus inordinatus TaxID=2496818 RepID=UPI00102CCE7A|nr:riboflavin synthase [Candidatus Magnetaquicoccus inordinatus]
MFTGLIEDVGQLLAMEHQGGEYLLRVRCTFPMAEIVLGDSIAVNGVCLTVTEKGSDWFAVQVSGETLQHSTFAHLRVGATLNLERALPLGGRLNGHLVQGHVDGVGYVQRVQPRGRSLEITFRVTAVVAKYIVAKGSIAVDGVSLTVNSVQESGEESSFSVNIIPHTQKKSTLAELIVNRAVNIETDILGRYVERLLAGSKGCARSGGGMDEHYLRERGF